MASITIKYGLKTGLKSRGEIVGGQGAYGNDRNAPKTSLPSALKTSG